MRSVSQYVAGAVVAVGLAGLPVGMTHAAETPVKHHGIATQDVGKVVPEAVRKIMDEQTKDAKQPFYQWQERDGKKYYTVHYTKPDGRRMFMRISEAGKLVVGPMESFSAVKNDANPDVGKDPSKPIGKREKITREQLPEAVRKTFDSMAANGKSFGFQKQTRGDEVSYVVDWTVGGDDTTARIGADGKVIEGSPLAAGTATAQAPAPTAPNQPAQPVPAQPQAPAQPSAEELAQQAAAKATAERDAALAAASYQILSSPSQLPGEVRGEIEKSAPGGSTDLVLQRFKNGAQNIYSVHFTTPDNKRQFMAVDQTGKIVIEPRASKAQPGGKGVRYEVVSGDKLPPEVLKAVEANGGTDHLLLARTNAKGDRTYIVQYTGAKGGGIL